MKQIKLLVAIFCIVCLSLETNAQGRNENYWYIGGSLNAFNYFGDLNPLSQRITTNFGFTRPNIGVEIGKKLSPRLNFKINLAWGRLRGDDFKSGDPDSDDLDRVARWGRNLHFRNDIIELAGIFTYDLIPSRGRFYRRAYFTPYLLAGVAGFYHNPKAKTPEDYSGAGAGAGEWVALAPLQTEGPNSSYDRLQIAFPVGIGLKWRISDRLDLAFEMAFRILMFDHLDDVGGLYPNINELPNELARAMFERSAEATAAVSGDSRADGLAKISASIGANPTNVYGDIPVEGSTSIGNQTIEAETRLVNYGLKGERRANAPKENDMYLVTGLHLTYIFRTSRHPRDPSR